MRHLPSRKRHLKKRDPFDNIDHDGAVDDGDDEEGPPMPRPKSDYKFVSKWWRDEYYLLAVCITAAIALGIVFKHYDEEIVPRLWLDIDFDVIIVAMFTCIRVAMSGIVESCISQAAWIWVSEARQAREKDMRARLEDFKIYDEAHLACIGALIVILVHGLEASSQQLYRYTNLPQADNTRPDSPDRPSPVPRSDYWNNTVKRGIDPRPVLNLSTKAAVYSGILSVDVVKLDVPCASINCTWPLTPTLAVCGECHSMQVEVMCTDKSQSCLYSMASGTSLDIAHDASSIERFNVKPLNEANRRRNSTDRTFVSVFDLLWVKKKKKNGRPAETIGQECALWFCMQTYNITVEESDLKQTVDHNWSTTRFENENNAHESEYVFVDVPANMEADQSRYSITKDALSALQSFFDGVIEGTYEGRDTIINFSSEWVEAMYNARGNLDEWIDRLSTSLTNEVRLHGEDREKNRTRYAGAGYTIEQVIYVDWM
ncbi:hypothetical protein CkaCkLH20_05782 [Colletotrichum karsti]|uniref:Uncharacterized protein n=1 Tax=Colletotrichum karsti TaxID=1095194 RepID=A0A9P6IAE8_9PEZI|nr:uncharacterized protein CkaCkLH20_05782 [Colletotrichum karsti]KAF9876936.1 hypothetical protein CkaCkLH20_05782 [Colletotrichum karsti]